MSSETHVHRARDRVESENEAMAEKYDALGSFADRIERIETAEQGTEAVGQSVSGAVAGVATRPGREQCETVRTAFERTVAPHSGCESEPVLESIREELGEEVAFALAPSSPTVFSRSVRERIRTAVTNRRQEIRVTRRALTREADSLDSAIETVDAVTDWLVDANETPLSSLDFTALQTRHERLAAHCRSCASSADERQSVLDATTSDGASVGVGHRGLVAYLYEDFPVSYPVLSTLARLLALIETAQRSVRDHLVRRV